MMYRIYTHSNQTNEGHISIHAHYKIPFSQANSPHTLQYPHLDGKDYTEKCTHQTTCVLRIFVNEMDFWIMQYMWNTVLEYIHTHRLRKFTAFVVTFASSPQKQNLHLYKK